MIEQFKDLDFYNYKNSFKQDEHIKTNLIFGDLSTPVPKYSILIPTLRRPELVQNAINCAINQKGFQDYEIIILDIEPKKDNETQQALKKYKQYKNIFIYQVESEDLSGWNRIIQLVRSEWFVVLADDDMLYPHYLKTIDSILNKHPEIEAIAPKYTFFGGNINKNPVPCPKYNKVRESFFKELKKVLRKYNLIPQKKREYYIGNYLMDHYYLRSAAFAPVGLMYKTKNVIDLGGWNLDFIGSADFILNVNYMLKHNLYYTSEILGEKNIGEGNGSNEKYYQKGFVFLAHYFYNNKKTLSYLKYIKFDDWFIQSVVLYMALVEAGLDFEDIQEGNLFNKDYYNMENMRKYREKAVEIDKQLAELHPHLDCYIHNLVNHKIIWQGLN